MKLTSRQAQNKADCEHRKASVFGQKSSMNIWHHNPRDAGLGTRYKSNSVDVTRTLPRRKQQMEGDATAQEGRHSF